MLELSFRYYGPLPNAIRVTLLGMAFRALRFIRHRI